MVQRTSRRRRFRRGAGAALVLGLCVGAAGLALWLNHRDIAGPRQSAQPSTTSFPPDAQQARNMLNALTVAWNDHWDSYARNAFGPGWAGRGGEPRLAGECTARDVVLRRDLREIKAAQRNPCIVLSGVVDDPYSGIRLSYNRFKAGDIEIDHLVALGDAWRSGAWAWPDEQRERFANDVDNLLVVRKQANQDKGSKSPDRWRPRPEYWCEYGKRWVAVKSRYGLHVTPPERDALTQLLDACPAP
ncbi:MULTISPECIES: HNH endonuclease family protein [unclassified Nocardia]|uniref:HNH endonuclease family protein n=1 Tax=unclassified Nocardia TaxID=2637762 RepID=UPI001CE4354D|nr:MULTISPECIES: HNH endonuclease family protein [unclassified Nocardia]